MTLEDPTAKRKKGIGVVEFPTELRDQFKR
jgi:hypothetical protein